MDNVWESMKQGAERAWENIKYDGECVWEYVVWATIVAWKWIRHNLLHYEQNVFQAGDPSVGDKICYGQHVIKETSKPYNFKHTLRPGQVISAISVLPLEKGLDSPETTIINGGINHNFVELRLIPSHIGKWGYDVKIYGRG